jgi:hypothetical protein
MLTMTVGKQKPKRWLPVTPALSSGSHTEEEGDITEIGIIDATKNVSDLLIDTTHNNETKSGPPEVQNSGATPFVEDDQDGRLQCQLLTLTVTQFTYTHFS